MKLIIEIHYFFHNSIDSTKRSIIIIFLPSIICLFIYKICKTVITIKYQRIQQFIIFSIFQYINTFSIILQQDQSYLNVKVLDLYITLYNIVENSINLQFLKVNFLEFLVEVVSIIIKLKLILIKAKVTIRWSFVICLFCFG